MSTTNIRQLQVVIDSLQDRLLVRIATSSHDEVRLFVTRRFLRELWPHLSRQLPVEGKPIAVETAESTPAPGSFDQDFQNDNPNYPLGSTPLLAAEAVVEPIAEGGCNLTLRELKERSFTVSLNTDLLQAFCAMLRAAASESQWDLDLSYAPATAPTIAFAESDGDMVLPPSKAKLH